MFEERLNSCVVLKFLGPVQPVNDQNPQVGKVVGIVSYKTVLFDGERIKGSFKEAMILELKGHHQLYWPNGSYSNFDAAWNIAEGVSNERLATACGKAVSCSDGKQWRQSLSNLDYPVEGLSCTIIYGGGFKLSFNGQESSFVDIFDGIKSHRRIGDVEWYRLGIRESKCESLWPNIRKELFSPSYQASGERRSTVNLHGLDR